MPFLGELNDKQIRKDEKEKALGDLKVGKAPGLDGIVLELLKYGREATVLWLERVLGVLYALKRVSCQEIIGVCVWCHVINE